MRYKAIVTNKLEALTNSLTQLKSLYTRNTPYDQFEQAVQQLKEKIEDIQTLINVEQEGI